MIEVLPGEVLLSMPVKPEYIHVGGVIVSSLLHKENLVRAMLTGKKQRPLIQQDEHQ